MRRATVRMPPKKTKKKDAPAVPVPSVDPFSRGPAAPAAETAPAADYFRGTPAFASTPAVPTAEELLALTPPSTADKAPTAEELLAEEAPPESAAPKSAAVTPKSRPVSNNQQPPQSPPGKMHGESSFCRAAIPAVSVSHAGLFVDTCFVTLPTSLSAARVAELFRAQ